jgi:hypothetical protein
MKLLNFQMFEKLEDDSSVFHGFYGSHHRAEKFDESLIENGNPDDGPGIYLSSSENEARNNGGPYVTPVTVKTHKLVSTHGVAKKTDISFLINAAPNIEEQLKKFDEDKAKAFFKAVDSINHGQTPHNIFLNIWNTFYNGDAKAFCAALVKGGYDATTLSKGTFVLYVVYNPKIITINQIK